MNPHDREKLAGIEAVMLVVDEMKGVPFETLPDALVDAHDGRCTEEIVRVIARDMVYLRKRVIESKQP